MKGLVQILAGLACGLILFPAAGAESWTTRLAQMPVRQKLEWITRTNAAEVLLENFVPDDTVKALILMPGATDEFYFYKRAQARITQPQPSLGDVLEALTQQTVLRLHFRPPLLSLYSPEDSLEPVIEISSPETAARLKQKSFNGPTRFRDRDWDAVRPFLADSFTSKWSGWPQILPLLNSTDSWHFYRHSLAAARLNGWEALEALSLAGKTRVKIEKRRIIFEPDDRPGAIPSGPMQGISPAVETRPAALEIK